MKNLLWLAGAAGLVMGACGNDPADPRGTRDAGPVVDSTPMADAGPDAAEQSDAAELPDAAINPDGPVIEILGPTAAAEGTFASDQIVTTGRFTGRCKVTPNVVSLATVDPASVSMLAAVGGQTYEIAAVPTPTLNEYAAELVVSDFPNGRLTIQCKASDANGESATEELKTYLDLGPTITVFNPPAGASFANQLVAQIQVLPQPLVAMMDTGAAVGAVKAYIGSTELTLTGPDANMLYTTTIDFDAPAFPTPLDGEIALRVTAANTRTPSAVTRETSTLFNADGQGPTISVDAPSVGQLISGILTITATVTDPAGVNAGSVVATIAHLHEVALTPAGTNKYSGTFDTRVLSNTWVYPPLEIRAQDSVGNQSAVGAVVALDNRPPVLDLDPPVVREGKLVEGQIACSTAFDPLGDDATNDGESVAQLSEMRLRIRDMGNGATSNSGVIFPLAGVNDLNVKLYVLDNASGALLVDTNNDGKCDEINPALTPASIPMTSNEAAVLGMVPVADSGASFFSAAAAPFDNGWDTVCTATGADTEPPKDLCVSTPLTRIIVREVTKEREIYAIPPLTNLACTGNAFDSAGTNISDGWACVAARATDKLGNIGVSAPLRVCFDADGDMAECPAWGTITTAGLPTCTDGCTPSSGFASGVIRVDL